MAGRINLRPADLPGFTSSPPDDALTKVEQEDIELARCSGGPDPARKIADVNSPDFEHEAGWQIASNVTVLPTVELVRQDLASMAGKKILSCLTRYLTQATPDEDGVTITDVVVTRRAVAAPGADAAFAFRITATVRGPDGSVPLATDVVGFAIGQAEVSLLAQGMGSGIPDRTRDELFALLLRRAVGQAA